jgi:outer membrane protein assembly factor BamB
LLDEPYLAAADSLVLVSSGGGSGTGISTAVTALSPATGRAAWRFDPGTTVTVEGVGPAGILLSSYAPDRLYLIDPATGRERWQATTFIEPAESSTQVALVTATDVILAEGQRGPSPDQRQRYVDRSAATGAVRWSVPLSGWAPPAVPALALGSLAVTATDPDSPGQATLSAVSQATGKPGWRVALPTTLWVPPTVVPSGVLAQSTDGSYGCPLAGSAAAPVRTPAPG